MLEFERLATGKRLTKTRLGDAAGGHNAPGCVVILLGGQTNFLVARKTSIRKGRDLLAVQVELLAADVRVSRDSDFLTKAYDIIRSTVVFFGLKNCVDGAGAGNKFFLGGCDAVGFVQAGDLVTHVTDEACVREGVPEHDRVTKVDAAVGAESLRDPLRALRILDLRVIQNEKVAFLGAHVVLELGLVLFPVFDPVSNTRLEAVLGSA